MTVTKLQMQAFQYVVIYLEQCGFIQKQIMCYQVNMPQIMSMLTITKKQHVWDRCLSDDRDLTHCIVHSVNSHPNYIT